MPKLIRDILKKRTERGNYSALFILSCLIAFFISFLPVYGQNDVDSGSDLSVYSDNFNIYKFSNSKHTENITGDFYGIKLRQSSWIGKFSININRSRFDASRFDKIKELSFELRQNSSSAAVNYYGESDWISADAGIRLTAAEEQNIIDYNGGFGIFLQDKNTKNYELSFSVQTPPLGLFAKYDKVNLALKNPLSIFSVGHKIRYRFPYFLLEADYETFTPRQVRNIFEYSLSSLSKFDRWSVNCGYGKDKPVFSGSIEKYSLRSEFGLQKDGLGFGYIKFTKLNYTRFELSYRDTGVDVWGLNLSAKYHYLDAKIIGSIESWPFTGIIESLFLSRLYFRGTAKIEAEEVEGRISYTFGKITFTPQLSIIRIVPDAAIETWQPIFLAIGVSHYVRSGFKIKEAGLAYFRLIIDFTMLGLDFKGSISQILPIYSVNKEISGTGQGFTDPLSSGSEDGGRWFNFSVTLPFAKKR